MVSLATKAFFAFAVALTAASFGYGVATSDAFGTTTLAFLAAGAATFAIASLIASGDVAPVVAPETPIAEQPRIGHTPAASLWPFGAAVGVGLLALGAATNGTVQLGALVVLVLSGSGWLVQHWTEDPASSSVFRARLRERFTLPFALPLGVIALVAIIAISLSRIFLALPEQGTRAVALAIAAVVLVAAFVIAASAQMARTALKLLTGFAVVAAVAAGIVGVAHGERKFEKPTITTPFVPRPGEPGPTTTSSTPSTPTTASSVTTP